LSEQTSWKVSFDALMKSAMVYSAEWARPTLAFCTMAFGLQLFFPVSCNIKQSEIKPIEEAASQRQRCFEVLMAVVFMLGP